jgi:hypothetical protein
VKFSCGSTFLFTRVTPIILHGNEMESSAKKSHRSSVYCRLRPQTSGSPSLQSVTVLAW